MYILFDHHPSQFVPVIIKHIDSWCRANNAQYKHKRAVNGLRLTFNDDRLYSAFALTWNPTNREIYRFRLIEPMQTRQPK